MKRFVNPHAEEIKRNLWDALLWQVGYYNDQEPEPAPPEGFSYPMRDRPFKKDEPSFIWINHSSYLVKIDGVHFLTDPIWSNRCSPVPFLGPKRRHEPGIKIEELPHIDYVLISHNHYDHMDKKSILRLHAIFPKITWLVPQGVKKWFIKHQITNIVELSWWQDANLDDRIKATAVPAQHFSGRRGHDTNQTLWVGWVIEFKRAAGTMKKFYFVGDTGYNPYDFKKIGMMWNSMDLSLIPIGSYSPRKFMSSVHIEPKDAAKIHKDVCSKLSSAMHWKTFRLSDEPMTAPPFALYNALKEANIDPHTFLVPEIGHEINW